MDDIEQDKQDSAVILNYLRIHKPDQATEEEARRYLKLMKLTSETLVAEDLEFAEFLHKKLLEDQAERGLRKDGQQES